MQELTGDVNMTIEKGEQLSAFLDGETGREENNTLISELCESEELKSCWERYHVISDSMRSGLPDSIHGGFADKVMSAIASEPAILAPQASISTKKSASNSTPMTKRFAGFAIAASVATLAVIGVQTMNNEDTTSHVATTMPDKSQFVGMDGKPRVASAKPVITQNSNSGFPNASTVSSSTSTVSVFKHPPMNNDYSPKSVDPQLLKYIVNHSQNASGSGGSDIFSPARIVTSPARIVTSTQIQGGTNQVQR